MFTPQKPAMRLSNLACAVLTNCSRVLLLTRSLLRKSKCALANFTLQSLLPLLARCSSMFQTTRPSELSLGQFFVRLQRLATRFTVRFLLQEQIRQRFLMLRESFRSPVPATGPLLEQPSLFSQPISTQIASMASNLERESTSTPRRPAVRPGSSGPSSGSTSSGRRGQSPSFLRSLRRRFGLGEFRRSVRRKGRRRAKTSSRLSKAFGMGL